MKINIWDTISFVQKFLEFNIEHLIYYFKDFKSKFINTTPKIEIIENDK